MKYYVLGTRNNEMLAFYLEKYYNLLQQKLLSLAEVGILTDVITTFQEKPSKDFLLHPDYSTVINILHAHFVKKQNFSFHVDIDTYLQIFKSELQLYLKGDTKKMYQYKGKNIGDTNIKLTTQVLNPLDHQNSHPEHKTNGGVKGWGERSEKEWLDIYSKTFKLLKKADKGVYEELNQVIKKIVPLGTSIGLHNSASYKEAIGYLYMGYTLDDTGKELAILEALIHESSHNKINLIMQFDALILNSRIEKYYSPYRPDARHIYGVYLGLHAFAPTIYILMLAIKSGNIGIDDGWKNKIVLYHIKNKISLKVLKKHGIFTELGQEILEEIEEVIQLGDKLLQTIKIDKETLKYIALQQHKHFNEVNINYPKLEY